MHDGAAAGGLAENGDALRVAAEEVDVGLHPFERQALVVEARVGRPVRLQRGTGQPAERAELHKVTLACGGMDDGALEPDVRGSSARRR